MNDEELKISKIMNMLDEAEQKKQTAEQEDYGYYAGEVDALKNVLDILQG